MGAPIRSQDEIAVVLNSGNNAVADLGYELIGDAKRGDDFDNTEYRDKVYRLILLRAYLKNLVDQRGEFRAWYTSEANEKAFNIMLDAVAQLSGFYAGPGIPLIRGRRIPLTIYGGTITINNYYGSGGVPFSNNDVDSPSEVVDSFPAASASEFIVYIYSVRGSNSGEGNRAGIIIAGFRAGEVEWYENKGADVGGITSPLTFTVAITAGNIELTAVASTDNWIVKGTRLT